VVAGEKGDGQPGVGQFGQLALQAHEALRNSVPVLKPEVEDVAEQVDSRRVLRHLVQPAHNTPLPRQRRRRVGRAQMKVGGEIHLAARWQQQVGQNMGHYGALRA
jgi:hypothetical protein